jgi:deazaflavin-dependent oxidoreductase (nitroreductase family)
MTDFDPVGFEDALIADMRANGGKVTTGPMAGTTLLVLNSKGAKTGKPRRAILTFSRDGADYVVAGSASGSRSDPAWLANVEADPKVNVEADGRTFEAAASVAEAADRDRLWDQHVATHPNFADYPAQTGRVIPMVRLTPVKDRP